jgi:hypothetical protein
MKIKAKIGPMECPQKYWEKTTEVEQPDDLPQVIIDEIIELYPDVKTGKAKNQDAKKRMIEFTIQYTKPIIAAEQIAVLVYKACGLV